MTRVTKSSPGTDNTRRTRRRRLSTAIVIGGTALAIVVGGYRWYRELTPQPPSVDLASLDPPIAEAIEEARQKVVQEPRSAAAWGRLGMVLAAHDLRDEAIRCLVRAEQLDQAEPRWPYYQGIILSLGDPEAAIPKLRRAVHLSGEDPAAPRLWLSEKLFGQGRLEEAEHGFRKVLEHDPSNPWARLRLARVAYQRGQLQESLAQLQQAVTDPRQRQACYALLAEIHQRLGDRATAASEYRQAGRLPPDPAWPDPFVEEIERLQVGEHAQLVFAEKLLGQNRLLEATSLLQQTVRDYPRSAAAWLILGRALLQQRNFTRAEQALRRAVDVQPSLVEAHYFLGTSLFQQGEVGAAAACFQKATQLKPDYAWAYYNLGQCLLTQADQAGAVTAFRMAVRCKPDFSDAHIDLATLLARAQQGAEAWIHLRYALQLEPSNPRAKQLLGLLLCRVWIWPTR